MQTILLLFLLKLASGDDSQTTPVANDLFSVSPPIGNEINGGDLNAMTSILPNEGDPSLVPNSMTSILPNEGDPSLVPNSMTSIFPNEGDPNLVTSGYGINPEITMDANQPTFGVSNNPMVPDQPDVNGGGLSMSFIIAKKF